ADSGADAGACRGPPRDFATGRPSPQSGFPAGLRTLPRWPARRPQDAAGAAHGRRFGTRRDGVWGRELVHARRRPPRCFGGPLGTDAWHLDVVVSGSQKALMTPPGLAAVAVSECAWAARGDSPRFYFDWERARKAQAALDAPFTPPVSLVAGLDVALGLLLDT